MIRRLSHSWYSYVFVILWNTLSLLRTISSSGCRRISLCSLSALVGSYTPTHVHTHIRTFTRTHKIARTWLKFDQVSSNPSFSGGALKSARTIHHALQHITHYGLTTERRRGGGKLWDSCRGKESIKRVKTARERERREVGGVLQKKKEEGGSVNLF